MPKVKVSKMRERYAQTVFTFRKTYVYLLFSLDLESGPESIMGQATLAERKAVRRFPLFRIAEILARNVCHLVSI